MDSQPMAGENRLLDARRVGGVGTFRSQVAHARAAMVVVSAAVLAGVAVRVCCEYHQRRIDSFDIASLHRVRRVLLSWCFLYEPGALAKLILAACVMRVRCGHPMGISSAVWRS